MLLTHIVRLSQWSQCEYMNIRSLRMLPNKSLSGSCFFQLSQSSEDFFSYIPGIFAITIQSRQSSGTKCATAKDQSNSNLLQFMVFYLRRTSLSMQTLMFRRPICEHFFHFMVCHVHTHAGETTELWLK